MVPSRTAPFRTVIKPLPHRQWHYPNAINIYIRIKCHLAKEPAHPSPSYSGTSQPGRERTVSACALSLRLRTAEARRAGRSPEGPEVFREREDKEGEKHPSLIYSLSLTSLPVLIIKMQPTAPPGCHNRKLIEYLCKPQRNHCFEEKQNLAARQSSGLPRRQRRLQNPILKLKELSVGSNYVTLEHWFFLEREAGCLGHSSAPPLGWILLPPPRHRCHPGSLLRAAGHPAMRLSIPELTHVKAGRRKEPCRSGRKKHGSRLQGHPRRASSCPLSILAVMMTNIDT